MHAVRLPAAAIAALLAGLGLIEGASAQEEIKPTKRRIVGGQKTDIKNHPWQVALQVRGQFHCGGSIVAERWIVTAAHCFERVQRAGEWRAKGRATNYATQGVWERIERIVVHPKYNRSNYEHDIALVKLKSKANGAVIPRAQATMTVPAGQELEVTGWGATSEKDVGGSRVLQKVGVRYVDTATCNAPDAYKGQIAAGMLCAGYPEGGKDACQGDSGGPLVWKTQDGPVLVGVVSWGEGCARVQKYGVYTRVSAYRDWIDQTIAADRP